MDKIKDLMRKIGIKPELATKLCEAIEGNKRTFEQQLQAKFDAKLAEAKRVCVEEVEAHKRELSRRLQVFCEAKNLTIDATIARQSAHRDSEAQTTLRNIQGLLEGVVAIGEPNGKAQAEYQKLQRQLRKVTEERDQAVSTANRQTAICTKVLKRNRQLESRSPQQAQVTESAAPAPARRLDQQRGGGRPTSTRPTLQESQARHRPPARPQHPAADPSSWSLDNIAAQMDGHLA